MNPFNGPIKKDFTGVLLRIREIARALPFLGPLFGFLDSRKGLIASAVIAGLVSQYPRLADAEGLLVAVLVELLGVGLVAAAAILGIALEDAAEKR